MTFQEKLQMLRKNKNLSQEQLAELIGVSRQAVSKWELKESMPDTANLVQLSRIFGCSIDYLLKDDADDSTAEHKNKNASFIFPLALGIIFIGLLTVIIGWISTQTLLPVYLGILIQAAGIIFFEVIHVYYHNSSRGRIRFYSAAVWLVMPLLCGWIMTVFFNYYPKPISVLSINLLNFLLYAAACTFITVLLQVAGRNKK